MDMSVCLGVRLPEGVLHFHVYLEYPRIKIQNDDANVHNCDSQIKQVEI